MSSSATPLPGTSTVAVRGRIETVRGMCTDERSHVEIDQALSEILDALDQIPRLRDDAHLLAIAADAADAALLNRCAGTGIAKAILHHIDRELVARKQAT